MASRQPPGFDVISRISSPALAIAAIVFVQLGAAIAKTQFDRVSPIEAAALRLAIGALLLFAIVRPDVRRWRRVQWLSVLAFGLTLGGMNCFIYLSFARIPIGAAITIEILGPLTLSLLHTRRPRELIWAALALVGVLLLGSSAFGGGQLLGFVFAAFAACCWAGYILMSRAVGSRIPGIDGLAVSLLFAMLLPLPFALPAVVVSVVAAPDLLLIFLGVALLSTVLPYSLEMVALRGIPTRVFGVLQSLSPAAAALLAFLVIREGLSWIDIIAVVCVTLASIGVTLTGRRPSDVGVPEQSHGGTAPA